MTTIGFIGLGVMGEPMCRNLAQKSGHTVLAFDRDPAALARLAPHGIQPATSIAGLAQTAETIFMALPSGAHVEAVCTDLLPHARPGQVLVDLGTSPVALTRDLAARFAHHGAHYADAPIARTRQAAEAGTLSIMVGSSPALFDRIHPLLACMATDITRCGPVGTGQVSKLMNNMVLIQTVIALAEAVAIARHAGMEPEALLQTLAKGSADSFALRNHGLNAIVPGAYPERAFSTEYARKDLGYALDLARELGLDLRGAAMADERLRETVEAGFGAQYWPVVARVIDKEGTAVLGLPG